MTRDAQFSLISRDFIYFSAEFSIFFYKFYMYIQIYRVPENFRQIRCHFTELYAKVMVGLSETRVGRFKKDQLENSGCRLPVASV